MVIPVSLAQHLLPLGTMLRGQASSFNRDVVACCMDDAKVASGLRHGDAQSIEFVLQRYVPALYRFAYFQLQDAVLAEDLVSEVMVRMIGRIDAFHLGEGTFQSWLFRIARNLVADYYRARKRRPQISLEQWLEADPTHDPGTNDAEMELLADREEIMAGLAALTDEQREVILLHVVEGWEMPQVAELLDRSVPSIKGLYYRGIQSLRRALTCDQGDAGRLVDRGEPIPKMVSATDA